MGTINDPIYVKVSTHTQSPDGSTRNEVFYMTATLSAYASQLANNIATPVYNLVAADSGSIAWPGPNASQYVSDSYIQIPSGGPVSLRAEVGIGFEPLATPTRYHTVKWDQLSTPVAGNLTVGGQIIYNWVDGLLKQLTPFYLYQGVQLP